MTPEIIQPMPQLSPDQFDALRADISARGVLVPIVKDQHGRIIDGNHRSLIAAELGIDCPITVVEVADDADAWERAVALNCARRHLTREQTRTVIAGEIQRGPEDSDRAIARRVGCSPTTVGSVRAEVSKLDSLEPEFAEIAHHMMVWGVSLVVDLICDGNGTDYATARAAWRAGIDWLRDRGDQFPGRAAAVFLEGRVWQPVDEYLEADRRLHRTGARTHANLTPESRNEHLEDLRESVLPLCAVVLRETWPDIFTDTADQWVLSKLDTRPTGGVG
ncbi:hypothetical protein TUM20983_20410 [Mycobacterium antarcticum]|uniref:ParB N-terminal domain-containing protein n=1 Tax=Mycolicibacterium sp. TUM20983 TaxID=3023369 RepID=UPI00238CC730|nr:ParB N-terminal domain-containing protein [Mycolicibacterium sp. TUM20983]GLP74931.1 hypothetical protein TUM20983_20410 [Mycolicibacterium sp. TUM20983]